MPTPFYHLSVAEEILQHPALGEKVLQELLHRRGQFLLGNTSPDVQVISRQRREETHFFTLPIREDSPPAWEAMLADHPDLLDGRNPSPGGSAFIAGYLCHLQADWYWVKEIFAPVFGPTCPWSSFGRRLYLHNVLRAHLDQQVLPALPGDEGTALSLTPIYPWLPFVARDHLVSWREWLAGQLRPGSVPQTVEVFAARQGISPQEFYELLQSEEKMEQHVFNRLPREELEHFRRKLVNENVRLLNHLFDG